MIKADLAADGELLVGSKDSIQKTKKMPYPPSQNSSPDPYLQTTSKAASIYDYNAGGETPKKGLLFSMLESSNLNFFTLYK